LGGAVQKGIKEREVFEEESRVGVNIVGGELSASFNRTGEKTRQGCALTGKRERREEKFEKRDDSEGGGKMPSCNALTNVRRKGGNRARFSNPTWRGGEEENFAQNEAPKVKGKIKAKQAVKLKLRGRGGGPVIANVVCCETTKDDEKRV